MIKHLLSLSILLYITVSSAQLITNNGADLTVQGTLELTVKGDFLNASDGTIDNDGTINISGDVTNDASTTMFTAGTGTVVLSGSAQQDVDGTATTTNFYNLTINNSSAGGVLLGIGLSVSNTLTMTDGDVQLNGETIDLGTTGTLTGETNTNRIYGTTGQLQATRTVNNPSSLNVAGIGFIITTAANMGVTQFVRKHNQITAGGTSIFRNVEMTPTNNAGSDMTLRFNYFENELGGLTEALLHGERSTNGGSSWVRKPTVLNTGSDYADLTTNSNYALFTLSADVALPLKWLSFEAKLTENNHVSLTWVTGQEKGVSHFEVERSTTGEAFEKIGIVNAANQSGVNSYFDVDKTPNSGINYYRIRQVDVDGASTYTQIREVFIKNRQASSSEVYINSDGSLVLKGLSPDNYTLYIYTSYGQELKKLDIEIQTNAYIMYIPEVTEGIYYYHLHNQTAPVRTGKLRRL